MFWTFLLLILIIYIWASGGFKWAHRTFGAIRLFSPFKPETVKKLNTAEPKFKVMTWNIAYGYGLGSAQDSWKRRPFIDFQTHLQNISKIIKESGADIVLLQEIDFDSARSYHIDQLKFLQEQTGFPYAAEAITWEAGYIPHPLKDPKNHIGAMNSGGAVLSRFPILENRVVLFPRAKEVPLLSRNFYFFRYAQELLFDFGLEKGWWINLHLDAFFPETRYRQAARLSSRIKNLLHNKNENILGFGGDFNSLPAEAEKKFGFVDHPADDYRGDETLSLFRGLEDFQWQTTSHSFPANEPTRTLDHLFIHKKLKCLKVETLSVGEGASDHLPVLAEMQFKV